MLKKVYLIAIALISMVVVSLFFAQHGRASEKINLSEEEETFINEHPIIEIGIDPRFVPFEFIDRDGEYKGITADYLALVEERTGLRFKAQKNLTWPEAYDKALSHEIPMLSAISRTEDREQYFIFSKAYYHFKRVIVTRTDEKGIQGIEDLSGTLVAVQKGSSHHSYLLGFPDINLSLYDAVEDALTAVANGTETAFVGNLATTNYLIQNSALTNLKFTAFEADKSLAIHFAVRKDWPVLIDILNKALDTITDEERMEIASRWISVSSEPDFGPFLRIIALIGATALIILGVSFYWILKLKREVKHREEIQLKLEAAKMEAEEANDFKSSFLARMSHEVRTPLNAIVGMSYLLRKTEITLTQRTYIDRITQASNNMLSIINDILDYAKIEKGKVELEITSFSLDQVIQNVISIVSYKIDEQGIGLRLIKDSKVPNWFFGDGKRLEQILLNLMNNASKFTQKGEVLLEIRLLAREGSKYHLCFTVEDTGIGMNDTQISRLFVPFTQADSTITRRFGGSGLGLSIVKHLVELMHGTIEVYSTENEGSTFSVKITLPVDEERQDQYSRRLSSNQFKDIRTLVLEKNGASMNLIESYLRSFGMQCELTTSEKSALSILENAAKPFAGQIHLLILDYDAPKNGGLQFAKEIYENSRITVKPKILLLVPMMREELFDEVKNYPVHLALGKPIIPSVLLDGIIDLFDAKATTGIHEEVQLYQGKEGVKMRKSVLLVEDNKTNQLIAKSLLSRIGVDTIVASDGLQGVDLFKEHQKSIGLVLMDLHMPVMNGFESAEIIRALDKEAPIVAMTADVVLGVKEKCKEHGMNHFISKPFDPDDFIRQVMVLLDEHELSSPKKALLDVSSGLKNMGGNELLYLEVLREYQKENQEFLIELNRLIKSRAYEEVEHLIHKLKSSSGSIGAKEIYDYCVKFQKVLQDGKDIDILMYKSDFTDLFQRLLEEIQYYVEK